MSIPLGYPSQPPGSVCRLTKSLYGLKHANRQWFEKLTTSLKSIGFKQSYINTSLFTYINGQQFTVLLVYVDDIILAGNNLFHMSNVKSHLDQAFNIKDLGALHYYLGIELFRNHNGLSLCQRKYTLELLSLAGVLDSKPVSTPLEPSVKLEPNEGDLLPDPTLYRTLVGKLIYITITRPDITYAAQALSQFSHSPRTTHMKALLRTLRYLKLCPGQGMFFSTAPSNSLITYCDSDWASCNYSRRSVTGFTIFLGQSLISWQSKKQIVVYRSSTEAKYRAMADTSYEISWLKCLLHELQVPVSTPTIIMCDNSSTISLTSNHVQHARTKHIEIDCYFVRDKIKQGLLLPKFVPSHAQVVDLLTKALPRHLHYNCLSKLAVCNPYSLPTCGGHNIIQESITEENDH
uniref:uncharacterized mitochondrial protein AtMg00810-like n=1 Tax=Erigeron canadensis TaxID=72917 RepID=UPI001CB9099F|nr:uncharacterized mitochondrial protein AtMg00810-like [Erigeron canadensis]